MPAGCAPLVPAGCVPLVSAGCAEASVPAGCVPLVPAGCAGVVPIAGAGVEGCASAVGAAGSASVFVAVGCCGAAGTAGCCGAGAVGCTVSSAVVPPPPQPANRTATVRVMALATGVKGVMACTFTKNECWKWRENTARSAAGFAGAAEHEGEHTIAQRWRKGAQRKARQGVSHLPNPEKRQEFWRPSHRRQQYRLASR